jgi:hypothetical protein
MSTKSTDKIEKYGLLWPSKAHDLEIEMACIRKRIEPLNEHYEAMRKILWPRLDSHRWHVLCRDEMVKNKATVLMGAGSTGKTHSAAWYGLCKWFCDPENTCVMVSSTDIRGLKLRVWGEISTLWQEAINRFDWLPGHMLDSRLAITFQSLTEDDIDDRTVRDMRQAIVGIPCMQGGKFVGLGKFIGLKQKNILLIADECSLMSSSFLSACSNLNKNPFFQAIFLGNPLDVSDPLGKAAEPRDGWDSHMEPEKTSVWDTNFMGGRCVNLIGTDSPNMDYPDNEPPRFPYLITRKQIEETSKSFDKNSFEFYSQCKGCMRIGILARRVLTSDLCRKFGAQEPVVWETGETVKIAGLDAAYGGDRCISGHVEFGKEVGGKTVLMIHPPQIVPVLSNSQMIPEDQIATWVKEYCQTHGIQPENFFHDSTGRGSLGTSLARIWSSACNPVEFGGAPTTRPVTNETFWDDPKTRQRRLKLCNEHYFNFVTELWYSMRYAVEAGQIRGLPSDVMEELCMRQWDMRNERIQVEPKSGTSERPGMKQRTGRSPDLGDFVAICLEGARRRGFQIGKLSNEKARQQTWAWMQKTHAESVRIDRAYELVY